MECNRPRCYSCGQRGHLANKSPSKPAMLCGQGTDPRSELVCCGTVEGKPIDRILLDTGAVTNLVHRDLLPASRNRPHQMRRQKRAKRQRRAEAMRDELDHPLNITHQELKELQEGDKSLRSAWKQAHTVSLGEGNMFFVREGLLYCRWSPVGASEEREVEQLVLPQQCRESVLQLAHSIPLVGHLGKRKMADRILQRFYWPTLFKVDV